MGCVCAEQRVASSSRGLVNMLCLQAGSHVENKVTGTPCTA